MHLQASKHGAAMPLNAMQLRNSISMHDHAIPHRPTSITTMPSPLALTQTLISTSLHPPLSNRMPCLCPLANPPLANPPEDAMPCIIPTHAMPPTHAILRPRLHVLCYVVLPRLSHSSLSLSLSLYPPPLPTTILSLHAFQPLPTTILTLHAFHPFLSHHPFPHCWPPPLATQRDAYERCVCVCAYERCVCVCPCMPRERCVCVHACMHVSQCDTCLSASSAAAFAF